MQKNEIYNGQFVWHEGIEKTVWLTREAPEGFVFVEWSNSSDGDMTYEYAKAMDLSPYESAITSIKE
ncbi:MAG: hypothetical protein JST47_13215 [Bacteroidetes bacterium]|nr:hypothetical protein [Bacteroidota bacterium]